MASKAESKTPPEAFNIYLPTHSEGQLIGAELVETYELGPSHERPPLGARLQELEFLTGVAHLWEPVEHADTARGVVAQAAAGKKASEEAEAAKEQADQAERDRTEQEASAVAKARIAQLLDPEGFAKAQITAAIEAEHDALAAFASKGEKTKLEEVKEARLAAL